MRRAVRRVRVGGPRARAEDGFILLESLVAISLITVVMGALASLTLNVVTGTTELRARQGATQLATSAMATLSSVPASDLVTGRDPTSVNAQFDAASPTVQSWLGAMTRATDPLNPAAGTGRTATATIPTVQDPATLNGVTYQVGTYLGRCALRDASSTDCVVAGTGTRHLRAVVAVTWSGRGCRTATCTYLTATLVNSDLDPVFNTNRANPPSAPVATNPGPQVSTRDTPVSVQLAVDAGTGLDPLTWQVTTGTLPTGLSLSADGLVSGTPTALANPASLTVTVRDPFGRAGTTTFSWSVVAPPTITTPPTQTTVRNQQVSLALGSTCSNTACSYAMTGAPPGLTIDAATGVISGRPTTVGAYSVVATVTDRAGATASTSSFSWVIAAAPPTISEPGTLRARVGTAVSVQVTYTCPVGPCTVTLSGPMPGVGLSQTTPNTANNTTLSLSRPTGSGTIYLAGTVQTAAVSTGSTTRAYAPVLSITAAGDPGSTSAPGSWTATATVLVNYAIGRSTTQSSTNGDNVSSRAVDGTTTGATGTRTDNEARPWWQVDLGASSTVSSIVLYRRANESLPAGRVFMSDSDMAGKSYATLQNDPNVTELTFAAVTGDSVTLAAGDTLRRFVRVQLSSNSSARLNLAEVQVFGPNLAAGQATSQSSTGYNGDSGRAVDGVTNGVYNNNSTTHTTETTDEPWWQVDLGTVALVDAITVWNRTDCCADRLNGAVVFLSATDMGTRSYADLRDDPDVGEGTFGSTVARTAIEVDAFAARYVRIVVPGSNKILSLSEVQVNGRVP